MTMKIIIMAVGLALAVSITTGRAQTTNTLTYTNHAVVTLDVDDATWIGVLGLATFSGAKTNNPAALAAYARQVLRPTFVAAEVEPVSALRRQLIQAIARMPADKLTTVTNAVPVVR